MNPEFWHHRWKNREIAFHNNHPNPILPTHFHSLRLQPKSRIFVPLCGKTLDIGWLTSQGYDVIGVELSQTAVEELFSELGLTPRVSDVGPLKRFEAQSITVYNGDIFHLTQAAIGKIHAIYDRAALVALPPDMRPRYTRHLMDLARTPPQLLVSFEYDQSQMDGPPFSVPEPEITEHYAARYTIEQLSKETIPGGLKRAEPAIEAVWRLSRRDP